MLTNDRAAGVARVGLAWLKERTIGSEADLLRVFRIRDAPVPSVRAEAAAWLIAQIKEKSFARAEHLRDLIDSRFEDVRRAALTLMRGDDRFREDETLWRALAE